MIFQTPEYAAQLILAAFLYFVLRRRVILPDSRDGVRRWGVAWVIIITAPFWTLGPFSFSFYDDTITFGVLIHQYIASLPSGTTFAHGFGGGMDIHTISQFSGPFISFERILASVPPLWLGLAVFQIVIASIGFLGGYRLSRALGSGRQAAYAAAIFATLATQLVHYNSFWNGALTASLPLAVYLLICRQGKRYYWPGVLCFGFWTAVTCMIPTSLINFMFVIPLAALMINWRACPRLAAALGVVLGCVVLNMHEQIYGMMTVAPHTTRGISSLTDIDVLQQNNPLIDQRKSMPVIMLICSLAAVCAAAWTRKRIDAAAARAALGVLIYFPLVFLAASLPYEALGLKFLKSAGWHYLNHGFFVPVLILLANASRLWPPLTAVSAAFTAAKIAVLFAVLAPFWLSSGGAGNIRLDSLIDPPWKPDSLVRTVNIPFRLASNQFAVLGYESASGFTSLEPKAVTPYWRALRSSDPDLAGRPVGPNLRGAFSSDAVTKCCLEYDLTKFGIDLNLLRLINVGFIFSHLPLSGPYVTKVAGPPDGTVLPRAGTPYLERIGPYIEWLIEPTEPYVYALADPFPRVYAPKGRAVAADGADYKTLMAAVGEDALTGGLVVRESDSRTLGPAPGAAKVVSFEQILNGYDVTLEPSGGTSNAAVILNVVYTPFWRAYADGVPVPLVQANQIQMAAAVPPGTRSLTFRYERPLLREKLFGK